MHSFLSKVFGRKEKDTETSPTTLRPGELLDGKFEAISPNVSPSAANFLELESPKTDGENGKDKDKDRDARFSLFRAKSRPSPPEITYKAPIPLPQLSLNFSSTNGESSARTLESFLSVDPDAHILLSDAIIGRRRLNPLEALVLIRACSQAIVARGLETLGVMHPHWYSASPEVQRRLLSQFIHSMEPKTPLTAISLTPALATSPFESEIDSTRSPHDIAAVLRWGLRHLQLEGDSFGTDDGWYKAFLDAEAAAEYPPKAFSDKLAPTLPKAHLDLLIATLEIFSSLAAHSEANSTSGSKLSKIFGLWLLTSKRVEDKDDWKSFYARWERMGRMLEHLFLARIRDESIDQRMPVRLLELVRRYPYTHGLSSPTTDVQFLSPPHFTTRRYDALYVRIEVELSSERRKPKLKVHPLNILADAFSTKVEGGEYAELWAKITAASKTGSSPSPLSNIFADETIRFLSIVPDKASDKVQEAKSPVFSLLSPTLARGHSTSVGEADRPAPSPSRGHSFSVGEQSKPSHKHSKSATEPPPPSATSAIGSDWVQFSSSGFLDSTPAIAPLVSTLFDTDIEKTTPLTTTLSRKSSKRGKAVSRKSVDFTSEPTPPRSPPPVEVVKKEATAIVRASKLEVIELDEAFIDFWSDSLLDPITATWPTFIICKFKSTLVPHLLYGPIDEAGKQKSLKWLVLEQAFTVRPAPPPSPSAVPLPDSARPVSPALSTSGRNRFSFWSMSRTVSSSSQSSQKGKKKEKALNVGEMGELLEEETAEQVNKDVVQLKAAPTKSQKSKTEKPSEPIVPPAESSKAREVTIPAVAESPAPVAAIQAPIIEPQGLPAEAQPPLAEAPATVSGTPAAESEAAVAEVSAPIDQLQAPTAESPAVVDEVSAAEPEEAPAETESSTNDTQAPIAEAESVEAPETQAPPSEDKSSDPELLTSQAQLSVAEAELSTPQVEVSGVETLSTVAEPEVFQPVQAEPPAAEPHAPVVEAQEQIHEPEAQAPVAEVVSPKVAEHMVEAPVEDAATPVFEAEEAAIESQSPVADIPTPGVETSSPVPAVEAPSLDVKEIPLVETQKESIEGPVPVAEVPSSSVDSKALVSEIAETQEPLIAALSSTHEEENPAPVDERSAVDVEGPVTESQVQEPGPTSAAEAEAVNGHPQILLAQDESPVLDEVASVETTAAQDVETPSIAKESEPSQVVEEEPESEASTLEAAIAEAQAAPIVERAITPQFETEAAQVAYEAASVEPDSWVTVDDVPAVAEVAESTGPEDAVDTASTGVAGVPNERTAAPEAPETIPVPADEANTEDEELLDTVSSENLEESSFEVIVAESPADEEVVQPDVEESAEGGSVHAEVPVTSTEETHVFEESSHETDVKEGAATEAAGGVEEDVITPDNEDKQESISDMDFAEAIHSNSDDIQTTSVVNPVADAAIPAAELAGVSDDISHNVAEPAPKFHVSNGEEESSRKGIYETLPSAVSAEATEKNVRDVEIPIAVPSSTDQTLDNSSEDLIAEEPATLEEPTESINVISSVPVIETLVVPEESPADELVDIPAVPLVDVDVNQSVPSDTTRIIIPVQDVVSEELPKAQEDSSSLTNEQESHLVEDATILSGSTPGPHVALSVPESPMEDTDNFTEEHVAEGTELDEGIKAVEKETDSIASEANPVNVSVVDESISNVAYDDSLDDIGVAPSMAPSVTFSQQPVVEPPHSDTVNSDAKYEHEVPNVENADAGIEETLATEEVDDRDTSAPEASIVEGQSLVDGSGDEDRPVVDMAELLEENTSTSADLASDEPPADQQLPSDEISTFAGSTTEVFADGAITGVVVEDLTSEDLIAASKEVESVVDDDTSPEDLTQKESEPAPAVSSFIDEPAQVVDDEPPIEEPLSAIADDLSVEELAPTEHKEAAPAVTEVLPTEELPAVTNEPHHEEPSPVIASDRGVEEPFSALAAESSIEELALPAAEESPVEEALPASGDELLIEEQTPIQANEALVEEPSFTTGHIPQEEQAPAASNEQLGEELEPIVPNEVVAQESNPTVTAESFVEELVPSADDAVPTEEPAAGLNQEAVIEVPVSTVTVSPVGETVGVLVSSMAERSLIAESAHSVAETPLPSEVPELLVEEPASAAAEASLGEEPAAPLADELLAEKPVTALADELLAEEPALDITDELAVKDSSIATDQTVEEPTPVVANASLVDQPPPLVDNATVQEPSALVEEEFVDEQIPSVAEESHLEQPITLPFDEQLVSDAASQSIAEELTPSVIEIPVVEEIVPSAIDKSLLEESTPAAEPPVVEESVAAVNDEPLSEKSGPPVEMPASEQLVPAVVDQSVVDAPAPPSVETPVVEESISAVVDEAVAEESEHHAVEDQFVGESVPALIDEEVVEEMAHCGSSGAPVLEEPVAAIIDLTDAEDSVPSIETHVVEERVPVAVDEQVEEESIHSAVTPVVEESAPAFVDGPVAEESAGSTVEVPIAEEHVPSATVEESAPAVETPIVEEPVAAVNDEAVAEDLAISVDEAPVPEEPVPSAIVEELAPPAAETPVVEEPVTAVNNEAVAGVLAIPVDDAPVVEEPVSVAPIEESILSAATPINEEHVSANQNEAVAEELVSSIETFVVEEQVSAYANESVAEQLVEPAIESAVVDESIPALVDGPVVESGSSEAEPPGIEEPVSPAIDNSIVEESTMETPTVDDPVAIVTDKTASKESASSIEAPGIKEPILPVGVEPIVAESVPLVERPVDEEQISAAVDELVAEESILETVEERVSPVVDDAVVEESEHSSTPVVDEPLPAVSDEFVVEEPTPSAIEAPVVDEPTDVLPVEFAPSALEAPFVVASVPAVIDETIVAKSAPSTIETPVVDGPISAPVDETFISSSATSVIIEALVEEPVSDLISGPPAEEILSEVAHQSLTEEFTPATAKVLTEDKPASTDEEITFKEPAHVVVDGSLAEDLALSTADGQIREPVFAEATDEIRLEEPAFAAADKSHIEEHAPPPVDELPVEDEMPRANDDVHLEELPSDTDPPISSIEERAVVDALTHAEEDTSIQATSEVAQTVLVAEPHLERSQTPVETTSVDQQGPSETKVPITEPIPLASSQDVVDASQESLIDPPSEPHTENITHSPNIVGSDVDRPLHTEDLDLMAESVSNPDQHHLVSQVEGSVPMKEDLSFVGSASNTVVFEPTVPGDAIDLTQTILDASAPKFDDDRDQLEAVTSQVIENPTLFADTGDTSLDALPSEAQPHLETVLLPSLGEAADPEQQVAKDLTSIGQEESLSVPEDTGHPAASVEVPPSSIDEEIVLEDASDKIDTVTHEQAEEIIPEEQIEIGLLKTSAVTNDNVASEIALERPDGPTSLTSTPSNDVSNSVTVSKVEDAVDPLSPSIVASAELDPVSPSDELNGPGPSNSTVDGIAEPVQQSHVTGDASLDSLPNTLVDPVPANGPVVPSAEMKESPLVPVGDAGTEASDVDVTPVNKSLPVSSEEPAEQVQPVIGDGVLDDLTDQEDVTLDQIISGDPSRGAADTNDDLNNHKASSGPSDEPISAAEELIEPAPSLIKDLVVEPTTSTDVTPVATSTDEPPHIAKQDITDADIAPVSSEILVGTSKDDSDQPTIESVPESSKDFAIEHPSSAGEHVAAAEVIARISDAELIPEEPTINVGPSSPVEAGAETADIASFIQDPSTEASYVSEAILTAFDLHAAKEPLETAITKPDSEQVEPATLEMVSERLDTPADPDAELQLKADSEQTASTTEHPPVDSVPEPAASIPEIGQQTAPSSIEASTIDVTPSITEPVPIASAVDETVAATEPSQPLVVDSQLESSELTHEIAESASSASEDAIEVSSEINPVASTTEVAIDADSTSAVDNSAPEVSDVESFPLSDNQNVEQTLDSDQSTPSADGEHATSTLALEPLSLEAVVEEHASSVVEEPVESLSDIEKDAPTIRERVLQPSDHEAAIEDNDASVEPPVDLLPESQDLTTTSGAPSTTSEPIPDVSKSETVSPESIPSDESLTTHDDGQGHLTANVEGTTSVPDSELSVSEPTVEISAPSVIEESDKAPNKTEQDQAINVVPLTSQLVTEPESSASINAIEEPTPSVETQPTASSEPDSVGSAVDEVPMSLESVVPSAPETIVTDSSLVALDEDKTASDVDQVAVTVDAHPEASTTPESESSVDAILENSASAVEAPPTASSEIEQDPVSVDNPPSTSESSLESSVPHLAADEPVPISSPVENRVMETDEELTSLTTETASTTLTAQNTNETVAEEPVPTSVQKSSEEESSIVVETAPATEPADTEADVVPVISIVAQDPSFFDEDTLDAATTEELDDLVSPITDGSTMDPDASFATSGPFALESVISSIGEDDEDLALEDVSKASELDDDIFNGNGNGDHAKLYSETHDLEEDNTVVSPLAEVVDDVVGGSEVSNGHIHANAETSVVEVPSAESENVLAILDASGEEHAEKFDLSSQAQPTVDDNLTNTTDLKAAESASAEA